MVLERLREFIDSKGITIAAFEKSVGMANASLRKTLASGAGIGTDKLEKILITYPEISAEWLLRGEGSMLKGVALEHDKQLVEVCKTLVEVFEEKDAVISRLTTLIKNMEE